MGSGVKTPQEGLKALSRALSQMGLAKRIQVCLKFYLKYYCGQTSASIFVLCGFRRLLERHVYPLLSL